MNKSGIVAWLKASKKRRGQRWFVEAREEGVYITDGYALVRVPSLEFGKAILLECGIAPMAVGDTETHDGRGAKVPNLASLLVVPEGAAEMRPSVVLRRYTWSATNKPSVARIFAGAGRRLSIDEGLLSLFDDDIVNYGERLRFLADANSIYIQERGTTEGGPEWETVGRAMNVAMLDFEGHMRRTLAGDLTKDAPAEEPKLATGEVDEHGEWHPRIVATRGGQLRIECPAEFFPLVNRAWALNMDGLPRPEPQGHAMFDPENAEHYEVEPVMYDAGVVWPLDAFKGWFAANHPDREGASAAPPAVTHGGLTEPPAPIDAGAFGKFLFGKED